MTQTRQQSTVTDKDVKRFENRLLTKIGDYAKDNPELKVVEFNYCLCWGYGPEESFKDSISKSETEIRYIKSFIEYTKSFMERELKRKENIIFTLNVRLYPNLKELDKVVKCNELAKDLLVELEDDKQLVDVNKWREGEAKLAWAIADKYFTEYSNNIKDAAQISRLAQGFKKDTKHFLNKYSENECKEHFKQETTDLLAMLELAEENLVAPGIEKRNKYTIFLSEHELCSMMYDALKNVETIGYKDGNFCYFTIPHIDNLKKIICEHKEGDAIYKDDASISARAQDILIPNKFNTASSPRSNSPSSTRHLSYSPGTLRKLTFFPVLIETMYSQGADAKQIGHAAAEFVHFTPVNP